MPARTLYLLLLLFLLPGTRAPAQAPTNRTVNARADLASKEITIGDQLYLDINISAPSGTKVLPIDPALVDDLPGAEVIKDEELREVATSPELLLEQRFLITSFDTGYVTIPALPIYFEDAFGLRDTAYTNELLLTVKGAVVSAEDDILPIKPIMEEPRNLSDYWWVFLFLLVVALVLGYREYRRRQNAVAPPPPPPPPAHERALAQLDALEAQALWQNGRTEAYYVELTRVLRRYLEDRFRIPALEQTTRQITGELRERAGLDQDQREELSELLQLSDLVKFAQATPAEELHPRGMQRVRKFVRETGMEAVTETPPAAPASGVKVIE